jgi:phenylacetate-CoA ligase
VRGVNVFPTQIEELLLELEPLSAHYQIVLTREARLDEMEIVVEARPDFSDADVRAAAGARLTRLVKERIGVSARATVAAPGAIERSLGKAKRVVDRRPRE